MASKGMRFWLPSTVNVRGFPPYKSEDPWEGVKKTGMARATSTVIFENCPDEGSPPLKIHGEIFITDSNIARHLMFVSKNGLLRFNPQDAVDEGMVSYEEMKERGYQVIPPVAPVKVEPVKVEPVKERKVIKVDPTMTKNELIKLAGKNKLPVDVTLNKPELLKTIKNAIREREKSNGEATD